MGAALPYLFEHLFGATAALIVTVVCAVMGIFFLWLGHVHRDPDDPPLSFFRKSSTFVLAAAVCLGLCFAGWKMYVQKKNERHPIEILAPPQPIQKIPPVVDQKAINSDCSNVSAGGDVKIDCSPEKSNDKSNPLPKH